MGNQSGTLRWSRFIRITAGIGLALLATAHAAAEEPVAPARQDPAIAQALDDAARPYGGWSLVIDNDLFAASERDRDYTGGVALGVSGPQTGTYWWSLDPALRRLDRLALGRSSDRSLIQFSAQLGLLAFTPQDLSSDAIITDDRPYASLVYVTSARQYVDPAAQRVRHTGLMFGLLGLSLSSDIHSAIHRAVGSEQPRGYDNQISAGGEPTLRYVVGDSKLRAQRIALGSGLLETKTTAEVSLGYLTEASYALSTRIGQIDTPWWTFNPERIDYIAQPAAVAHPRGGSELYFWAGAKLRLHAYNAFCRDSSATACTRSAAGNCGT